MYNNGSGNNNNNESLNNNNNQNELQNFMNGNAIGRTSQHKNQIGENPSINNNLSASSNHKIISNIAGSYN